MLWTEQLTSTSQSVGFQNIFWLVSWKSLHCERRSWHSTWWVEITLQWAWWILDSYWQRGWTMYIMFTVLGNTENPSWASYSQVSLCLLCRSIFTYFQIQLGYLVSIPLDPSATEPPKTPEDWAFQFNTAENAYFKNQRARVRILAVWHFRSWMRPLETFTAKLWIMRSQ